METDTNKEGSIPDKNNLAAKFNQMALDFISKHPAVLKAISLCEQAASMGKQRKRIRNLSTNHIDLIDRYCRGNRFKTVVHNRCPCLRRLRECYCSEKELEDYSEADIEIEWQ